MPKACRTVLVSFFLVKPAVGCFESALVFDSHAQQVLRFRFQVSRPKVRWCCPLYPLFFSLNYREKLKEKNYRGNRNGFRGGAIYREKGGAIYREKGGRFIVMGGAIYRGQVGVFAWFSTIRESRVRPVPPPANSCFFGDGRRRMHEHQPAGNLLDLCFWVHRQDVF